MRVAHLALAAALAAAAPARAEDHPASGASAWKYALYLDAYAQAGASGYFVPTLFADRDRLHLEARYNYEDFDTASLWAGWAFSWGGEEDFLKATPMLGGVFGHTNGVAPGLEVEARWGRLGYWLEAEYLVDVQDTSASYLYGWSELDLYLQPWVWVGASAQRLRTLHSPREVDVGPAIGFGKQGTPGWTLSFYAYGLTRSEPSYLVTAALMF